MRRAKAIHSVIDDESTSLLSDGLNCTDFTDFRPANYADNEVFPAPAPGLPYFDRLSAFDGIDPNGTWSLYSRDDRDGQSGNILDWSLNIQTAPPADMIAKGSFTNPINTAAATGVWKTFAVADSNITPDPLSIAKSRQ